MRSTPCCSPVRRNPAPTVHIHNHTCPPIFDPQHPNPHQNTQQKPNNTDYLASLDPRLADPLPRTLLILSFTLTLSYLAWRGLDVAGKLAIGICVGCLLPFVALCVAGAFHLDLGRARAWRDDVDGVGTFGKGL